MQIATDNNTDKHPPQSYMWFGDLHYAFNVEGNIVISVLVVECPIKASFVHI